MKKKILLIDDDQDIVRGTKMRLSGAGYEIEAAYDGVAGVAAVANNPPDVIVLDVRMPRKDGMEVLCELKLDDKSRSIPVIMVSASVGDQQSALEGGASFFLKKPYQGTNLVATIGVALEAMHSETTEKS